MSMTTECIKCIELWDEIGYESGCCGAGFAEPGWPDNDICSSCGEHSEPFKCEDCE
jgi:hypothetical protein